jgi:sugar/nucleoside kinase (ribokinase family)
VVGNVGIDTNIYSQGGAFNPDVETHFTENLDYVGQAGGFASRGYARLGRKTGFIGYVGDDYCGQMIRHKFIQDGIDLSALFLDPTGTARSINWMDRDGKRRAFYDGKAHMSLKPDLELCRGVLSGAKLVHFNIPNWARHLLPLARQAGAMIACDVQDMPSVHDSYRQDFIQQADILFFSAVQTQNVAGIIEELLRWNPAQVVVVGLGARGCALGTRDGLRFFEPVSGEKLVVDTNGAGDSLAVGFLSSYVLDGYSLEDSVLRGQITARHVCSLKADSDHLINMGELDQRFRQLIGQRS